MALSVPTTGEVDFLTLANVFGLSSPPYSIASLKRDNVFVPNIPVNSNIPNTLANLDLRGFRGASVQFEVVLSSSTNVNLLTLFNNTYTSLSTVRKYIRFVIPSGVTVGATSTANAALDIGQFPNGTVIEIVNNGNIYGAGGSGGSGGTVYNAAVGAAGGPTNGGNGGDAIKANYLNQTVNIINNGNVYGGGGGGGGGGKGATGANGANGTLTQGPNYVYPNNTYWSEHPAGEFQFPETRTIIIWNSTSIINTSPLISSSTYTVGNTTYTKGNFVQSLFFSTAGTYKYYYVSQSTVTLGGTGGAGGNGGSGVSGRGNNNLITSLTGLSGTGGSAGTAGGGGTATAGATGTTGGSGGNGGDWGLSGSMGSGTNPGSGGTAGRYLLKGSANVTISGGTIGGLLA